MTQAHALLRRRHTLRRSHGKPGGSRTDHRALQVGPFVADNECMVPLRGFGRQVIDGNPLTSDEIRMFEMFERAGWPPEQRRAHILVLEVQSLRTRRSEPRRLAARVALEPRSLRAVSTKPSIFCQSNRPQDLLRRLTLLFPNIRRLLKLVCEGFHACL